MEVKIMESNKVYEGQKVGKGFRGMFLEIADD